MLASVSMWRTCSGLVTFRRAFRPLKPLRCVANSVSCQAEKVSSWTQLCQAVV